MKILVTGATSLIGKEIISVLLKEDHEIRTLTRQQTVPSILLKTQILVYELSDIPSNIAAGIDTVIHIAAATPGAGSSTESYFKTNVEGTRHLIKICEEQKVRRFIFISSIVVLDRENKDAYSVSKREAEAIITRSNLDWTILRPAEIIGADKSWEKFLQLLRNKKTVFVPGNGQQLRHPVFYRDVVNAIVQVMNNTNTSGKKYTLAASEPVGYYHFLELVRKYFICNFKIIIVPLWAIQILSFFKPLLPGKLKRKINNAHRMLRNTELDIQDAIAEFNFTPLGVEAGLKELKVELSL